MTDPGAAYREALDYLARYADEDWVMMSVVVSEARGVAGMSATRREVAGVMVDLASSLLDRGVVPGDLNDDFEPWPGSRAERLDRLRSELDVLVGRGELPVGPDICWFHHVPDQDV